MPAPKDMEPEEKLLSLINKLVISRGRIPTDPKVWEFHILDKVIKLDSEKVEKVSVFRSQYLKAFDMPAPHIGNKAWSWVLQSLVDDEKIEYADAPEESERVFIAKQIMETISSYPRTNKPEEAIAGMALYEHIVDKDTPDEKLYYCMPSKRFLTIVTDSGFKIAPQLLSEAMTELGMKHSGTPRVRYENMERSRSWCFVPEIVDEYSNDVPPEEGVN